MVVHGVPGWHSHGGTRAYWKVPCWCIGCQNSISSSILDLVTERYHSSDRVNWKVPWWCIGSQNSSSSSILGLVTERYHSSDRVNWKVPWWFEGITLVPVLS